MEYNDAEVILFQVCRILDGTVHNVTIGKHNGRPAAFFAPSITDFSPQVDNNVNQQKANKLFKELSAGLTETERRTWKKLIAGRSIAEIAKEEGVSRAAIYERIRGNSRAQGGMIAKNDYVAVWWCLRNKKAA